MSDPASEAIDSARAAVAKAAERLADKIGGNRLPAKDRKREAEALVDVANAVGAVAFGPQGWIGRTDTTTHDGDRRSSAAGFARTQP